MKLVAFLILFMVSPSTFAMTSREECTPIDHTAEMGPSRNQGDTNWCYGFTAADLLSFELKQKISAVAVVFSQPLIHFRKRTLKDTDFGWTNVALKNALSQGLCLEENLPSDVNDVIELYESNPDGFKREMKKRCGQKIHADGFTIERKVIKENLQPLNQVLDQGKISEIALDGAVFFDEGFLLKKVVTINHSSLVIGRRWNEQLNQCEYLTRNSFGNHCFNRRSDQDCRDGNAWVNEFELTRSAGQIISIHRD